MQKKIIFISLAIMMVLFMGGEVNSIFADSIDIPGYLMRTNITDYRPLSFFILIPCLFAFNYLVNCLAIGITAYKMGNISKKKLAVDLLLLTLLGQLADRAGAILAVFLNIPGSFILSKIFKFGGEVAPFVTLLLINMILAGIAIYFLVLYFMLRKWQIEKKWAVIISIFASVITNPTWGLWFPYEDSLGELAIMIFQ